MSQQKKKRQEKKPMFHWLQSWWTQWVVRAKSQSHSSALIFEPERVIACDFDGLPEGYYHDFPEDPEPSYTVCASGSCLWNIIVQCIDNFGDPLRIRLRSTHDLEDERRKWADSLPGATQFYRAHYEVQLEDWLSDEDINADLYVNFLNSFTAGDIHDRMKALDYKLQMNAREFRQDEVSQEKLKAILSRFQDIVTDDYHTDIFISGRGSLRLPQSKILSIIGAEGSRRQYERILAKSGLPVVYNVGTDIRIYQHLIKASDSFHDAFHNFIQEFAVYEVSKEEAQRPIRELDELLRDGPW